MAKFDAEQAAAVVAIQQLIAEWSYELDVNNGVNMAGLLTDDCSYTVRGAPRHGPAEVVAFYEQRLAELSQLPAGVPIHRHTLSNLRTSFAGADRAEIAFTLVYFTTLGIAAGTDHADPALVADVQMTCRRGADGHWRIQRFDSQPVFRRVSG
jgi:uncharacterized protein (TIGR02246 family)